VSHFYKPTPNVNSCFLLENPKQTPLAGGTRVRVAHRRQEETWRLPVRPLETVLRGRMCRYVRQAPRCRRLDMVQSGCSALSIIKQGTSWSSPTSATLGLFWAPHSTTTPSRRPAQRQPEAQPTT
jgi:hypothetical protein